jgi:hypothetical protein
LSAVTDVPATLRSLVIPSAANAAAGSVVRVMAAARKALSSRSLGVYRSSFVIKTSSFRRSAALCTAFFSLHPGAEKPACYSSNKRVQRAGEKSY